MNTQDNSSVRNRFVIVHGVGKVPFKLRPLYNNHEGVITLLEECLIHHPAAKLIVAEVTWDNDLWVSSGTEVLAIHRVTSDEIEDGASS